MGDSITTVVAILVAAVLIFVFPVMALAGRQDSTVKAEIQSKVDEFVNDVRTTGKLTEEKYEKFLDNIGTNDNNNYDVNMELKMLDENPGKKALQTATDKIGENIYYSVFTSQIEEALKTTGVTALRIQKLHEGDIFLVNVKNTNLTAAQQLTNYVYKFFGNDTYTILATSGGMVTTTAN